MPHFHDISFEALVPFLAIPNKTNVKLPEAEDSDESSFWHLMTAGKRYAANSGLITGCWRVVNEGPQGRQAVCCLCVSLWGNCQQESLSGKGSGSTRITALYINHHYADLFHCLLVKTLLIGGTGAIWGFLSVKGLMYV